MAVYFAQRIDSAFIKIGFSRDVRARLPLLAYQYGVKMRLLRVFKGGAREEKILHKRYEAFRLEGEWFRAEEPLISGDIGLPEISLPDVRREEPPADPNPNPNPLVVWRKRNGLTSTEVARRLGVPLARISQWELRVSRPPLERLHDIAVLTKGAVTANDWVAWLIRGEALLAAADQCPGKARAAA